LPNLAIAEDGFFKKSWSIVETELSETWQSPNTELYIPINTWHNRSFYTTEKIDGYNERPWGLGVGKYRYDEDGDWHGLYAMAFLDSQSDLEPIVGYGFQKVWRASDNVRLGLGYTAGMTMRKDSNYIPLPVLAPLFSIKYKQIALQSTYIVGGNGYGNVLFSWLRWEIN
jgi:lipid IVA palmitoyltransferase